MRVNPYMVLAGFVVTRIAVACSGGAAKTAESTHAASDLAESPPRFAEAQCLRAPGSTCAERSDRKDRWVTCVADR